MSELADVVTELDPRARRPRLIALVVRNPLALAGLIVISSMVIAAIFAGVLAPHDPAQTSLDLRNAPPGTPDHLLGADGSGRDIMSRLIFGSRTTLLGAALAIGVAILIGVPAGLLAGYYGRWVDAITSWVADILLSVPGMVVLLAVIAAFGSSIAFTMTAFGVVLSPHLFRLARAQTIAVRGNLYVDAARVAGLPDRRIIGRHILGVTRAPVIIQSANLAGIAIIVQSGLEFLGFGGGGQITWGAMLHNAFSVIYQAPTASIWPGAAIGLAVASLVLIGNGVRDGLQGTAAPQRRTPATSGVTSRPAEAVAPVADSVLDVRDLKVGYPRSDGTVSLVVEAADLVVRRGEVRGLVGESGSGKTQTAFAVLDLLPSGGQVLGGQIAVGGRDVLAMPRRGRRGLLGTTVAYVPQEPMSNLDPAFRVGHQLVEPMRAAGASRSAAKAKAIDLLAEVGISDPRRTFDAYPHEISGGMAQRVLIAGAVAGDPELLIADEPTTALDVTVQAEILTLLRRLQRDRDLGILLVTHNLGVVADICDSVTVMRHGRTVETAPVDELFAQPRHDYTLALLAASLDDTEPRPPLADEERP